MSGARGRLEVPPELTNLLLDFTVSVLVNKPGDLLEYASNYFRRMLDEKRNSNHLFGDSEAEESEVKPPIKLSFNRRKSVFAEHYDPEEDDEEDNEKVIYPKSDEQRQRLGEAVKTIFLFRSFDPQEMMEVLDAMFERKVEPGDMVIRQGDDGDYFYVIEKGTFKFFCTLDDGDYKELGEATDVGSFGELALMYNMPRSASVKAITAGSVWAMSRQTFRKIILKRAFKKRKTYEALLERVEMLQSLEMYERLNLADALEPRKFSDGDLIIKEGDEADGMYFIEQGTVRVTKINENGLEREISQLGSGCYFGELALITHKPRAASVIAKGDPVKVAFLDVGAFERLLGPCMDIMKRNFEHYEGQLVKIFGSPANISDLR